MLRTLIFVLLILAPGLATAQEAETQPLQELFLNELVYPQDKGEIQLTLGLRIDRNRADKAGLTPLSIEYGLTDRWQIEAAWDGVSKFAASPIRQLRTSKLSLGSKYSFMDIAHSHVHLAVGTEVEFPNPNAFTADETENDMELEPFLALAADLPGHLTIFGSARASFERDEAVELLLHGEHRDDPGTLSAGALWARPALAIAVEYASRTDMLPWRLDDIPLLTPSIAVHPGHKWELSAGLPIGLRGPYRPGIAINVIKEFR